MWVPAALGCSAGVIPGGQSILAQASLSLFLKISVARPVPGRTTQVCIVGSTQEAPARVAVKPTMMEKAITQAPGSRQLFW
jgi:hypothetical protein